MTEKLLAAWPPTTWKLRLGNTYPCIRALARQLKVSWPNDMKIGKRCRSEEHRVAKGVGVGSDCDAIRKEMPLGVMCLYIMSK